MSRLILIWVIEVFWAHDSTFKMTAAHFCHVGLPKVPRFKQGNGRKEIAEMIALLYFLVRLP